MIYVADADNRVSQQTADLLTLADTERWTTMRTLRTQSVAEHSFSVAVIAIELVCRLQGFMGDGIIDMAQVLSWALVHDGPENITADIDGRFKRMFPNIASSIKEAERSTFPWYASIQDAIPANLQMLVKVADHIEGIAFIRQWGIGAQADDVYQELRAILYRQAVPKLMTAFPHINSDDVLEAVHTTLERILAQTHTYRRRNRWVVSGG